MTFILKQSDFQLKDISFQIETGKLIAVIGPVGSGKVITL